MNAKLAALKSHFANWRAWEFNPIVIKELRQAVRSWAVPGVLLAFLLVLFLATLGFLINSSVNSASRELGAQIFGTFIAILGFMSVIFIPMYLATRINAERQESNHDLLYISTLSPERIIRGKFFCGAYITVLFFSACLPFMAFTNLLRGIDLPTVFGAMTMLFVAVCVLNMAAIFFACLPLSKGLKMLFTIGGFVFGTGIFGSFSVARMAMGGGSFFSLGGGGSTLTGWLTFLAIALALGLLFYFLAVALIAPPSANRALPVRLFLTIAWLLTGLWAAWGIVRYSRPELVMPWAMPWLMLLAVALINVIANHDRLSPRVLRDVPQNPAKRRLAFLFFNGAAGGLLWVTLLAVLTGALAFGCLLYFSASSAHRSGFTSDTDVYNFITIFISVTCYALAYALAGLFVHRRWLPHRSPKFAAIFALILAGGWAILPSVVLFFANHLSWSTLEKFQPGNLFNAFSLKNSADQYLHVICSAALLLVALLLNARWFAAQWKNFRPLEPRTDFTQPPPLP
jgi:hypothetical protein